MNTTAWALALLLAALLAVPMAAQSTEDGFAIRDGQVIGKRLEEGHVVLHLFGTSGDGLLEVLCPLTRTRDLLAEACDMFELGDVAPLWNGLAPDPTSLFPTLHRLSSVTMGRPADQFLISRGEVTGKRSVGSHVILELKGGSEAGLLEVLCPPQDPEDMLAKTCDMIELGDVAYLWDGLAPDQTSDFPALHRLTSVTLGTSVNSELFADGFESGTMLAWSASDP